MDDAEIQELLLVCEGVVADDKFTQIERSLGRPLTIGEKVKYRFRALRRVAEDQHRINHQQSFLINRLRERCKHLEWYQAKADMLGVEYGQLKKAKEDVG